MLNIADNVRQDLIKLVPSSIVNDITGFVFYDNHPKDNKNIDVIIYTLHGELREYYQRDVVCSIFLGACSKESEIKLIRNSKCELFYFVVVASKVFILHRRDNIRMHMTQEDVENYDIEDNACRGHACLQIKCEGDAVPLVFDDNLNSLGEDAAFLCQFIEYDTEPIITDLKRKLTQAKYNVKFYEASSKEIARLRQNSAFVNYKRINPNIPDGVFNAKDEVGGALKIKPHRPWVVVCNKKVVIIVEVLNKNILPVEDVHILLHHTAKSSIVYTTKLFERISAVPHWSQIESQHLNHNQEAALVVVIDLKELKYHVTSSIEFNAVVCYKMNEKEYMLSIDDVIKISTLETMGEQFDALSRIHSDKEDNIVLAVLATTIKIDLLFRYVKNNLEPYLDVPNVFKTYLKMEQLKNADNIIIHRRSPYHILHGTMVIVQEDDDRTAGDFYVFSLYARAPSHILTFIHYMHDAIPHRIIVTTSNQTITSKTEELSNHNEVSMSTPQILDFKEFGTSILNQISIMLEYFDNCMIKMSESKDPGVLQRIGHNIDIFAGGASDYVALRKKIIQEGYKGFQSLKLAPSSKKVVQELYKRVGPVKIPVASTSKPEVMVIEFD